MPRTLTNQAALGTSYADELDAIYDFAEATPTLGGITFSLTSAQTDALTPQVYYTEIHVKAPAPGSAEQCAGHDLAVCQVSTIGAI